MNNLKEISRMEFYHDGGIKILGVEVPFSRNWTLEGYDEGNNLICKTDKKEKHNYLKYVRFIKDLKNVGYKLRFQDRQLLKSGAKEFMLRAYVSQATRDDLYEIAMLTGHNKSMVDNIKFCKKEAKLEFAEIHGLELDELELILKDW